MLPACRAEALEGSAPAFAPTALRRGSLRMRSRAKAGEPKFRQLEPAGALVQGR